MRVFPLLSSVRAVSGSRRWIWWRSFCDLSWNTSESIHASRKMFSLVILLQRHLVQSILFFQSICDVPIDSQSPWQNGKTERAGQSFKHQLRDLDEKCHIEGEMEFEAAVGECCDARNRYCNRSKFSAHQRVLGSRLRLPEPVA